MKQLVTIALAMTFVAVSCNKSSKEEEEEASANETSANGKHLFMDVHNLEPGKVTFEAVAGAHQKDLATQGKYDVSFIKYWVDEAAGKVYCLAEAKDSASVYSTHKEAHGLVPDRVSMVSDGPEAKINDANALYLDVHELGAGNVTAADVAKAHEKDLATQDTYGVKFINYWVDENTGKVMCLSEAPGPDAIMSTHKAAHGLIPSTIEKVKEGH
jgi:hypothetical protein